MVRQKRKGQEAHPENGTANTSTRSLSARALPPSLLKGVIGGDGGEQSFVNNPSEPPPSRPPG